MRGFWNAFVKITGWPAQFFCFRTKTYYEDRQRQGRGIRGPAIVICNHTSVFDYVVLMFAFWSRTLRFQIAEVMFRKPLLGTLLRLLGGIYVNRDSHDIGCIAISEEIVQSGGIVGIFPEGRLPRAGEARPLPFKTGAAYLALSTGAQVIPVYTNGSYFNKKRARIMIGAPIKASDYADPKLSDRENIQLVAEAMRTRIIELGGLLDERGEGKASA